MALRSDDNATATFADADTLFRRRSTFGGKVL
jgi:hypothetical protein